MGTRLQAHLHPELARARHGGAANFDEEKVFGMAAAPDVHQLQHHGGGVRVELDKVDRLVGEAEAIDAHQVLGLTQALGPHFHLPHLLERRPGIGYSVVGPFAAVSGVLTYGERAEGD